MKPQPEEAAASAPGNLRAIAAAFGSALNGLHGHADAANAGLFPAILRILIDGRPAAVDDIAVVTGLPAEEVSGLVAQLRNVELDRHGRVIGLALSFLPTPHRVFLPDRDRHLYAWCVPDALMMPAVTGDRVRLMSSCHATGQPVSVSISSRGIDEVRPPDAVVSWWANAIDSCDIRGTACRDQNLFASADAAAGWLAERPGSIVVSVADALRATIHAVEQSGLTKMGRRPSETQHA